MALWSLVLTGHAATAPPAWLSALAVYVHGVAAAFWAGSLWPLWILLGRMTAEDGVRMVRRFSSLAIGLVAALLVAGSLLSILQLGSLDALLASSYGWTWIFKIGFVVPLVGLAAFNRQILLPNLARTGPTTLRRSIVAEATLFAAIVLATSLLGQTPPPRALAINEGGNQQIAVEQRQPLLLEIISGDYVARVDVLPGLTGQNAIFVKVFREKTDSVAAEEITTVWSLPSAGIEGLERPLSPTADGRFAGEVELPVEGRWQIEVEALVNDFEKTVFRADIRVPEARLCDEKDRKQQ